MAIIGQLPVLGGMFLDIRPWIRGLGRAAADRSDEPFDLLTGIQSRGRYRLGTALLYLLKDELLAVHAVLGNVSRELFTDILRMITAVPGFPVSCQRIAALIQVKGDRHRDMAASANFQTVIRHLVLLV